MMHSNIHFLWSRSQKNINSFLLLGKSIERSSNTQKWLIPFKNFEYCIWVEKKPPNQQTAFKKKFNKWILPQFCKNCDKKRRISIKNSVKYMSSEYKIPGQIIWNFHTVEASKAEYFTCTKHEHSIKQQTVSSFVTRTHS